MDTYCGSGRSLVRTSRSIHSRSARVTAGCQHRSRRLRTSAEMGPVSRCNDCRTRDVKRTSLVGQHIGPHWKTCAPYPGDRHCMEISA
jgi:hypothetical protein